MEWTRHTGTVLTAVVLTTVLANVAYYRQFENRSSARVQAEEPGTLILDLGDPVPVGVVGPRSLETAEFTAPLLPVVPAVQTSQARQAATDAGTVPDPVPVPGDAVPITEKAAVENQADAVRVVIEDELSGASREERDIWYEELKSIPAGVVRDLLQVRKQLRSLPRALHKLDSEPIRAPQVAELNADPVSQSRRQMAPDWLATMNSLEQACNIARHNLANSTTPGFKRLRVIPVDSYGIRWHDDEPADSRRPAHRGPIQADGCRLAETLLDLQPGPLQQTDRQLDLAIDGEGFFVASQNGKPVYCRCGAMVLDAQRRICLAVADGLTPLEPVITIPAEAREIQITATGTVQVLARLGADPMPVGQLVLARFPSPSRLRPAGGTLLAPTDGSGEAEVGAPDEQGRGVIQQGCLEQSNVDPEVELAEIEQWQTVLKSFPTVTRPVTASGKDPRSR